MATTQDPSILTSLEIPFVTCVSVPVIRHGSMKSLCLSVSWLGFPGATRATRELVSYDAWEEKGGKMLREMLFSLKWGTVSLATVGFFVGLSRWCLFCIEATGDVSISLHFTQGFPIHAEGSSQRNPCAIILEYIDGIKEYPHGKLNQTSFWICKIFGIYFRGSCVNILHC